MSWIIYGAGAQGRITLDILRARGEEASAFIDDSPRLVGQSIDGVRVISHEAARRPDTKIIVAIGDNRSRLRLAEEERNARAGFGAIIHPHASVLPSATIGEGTVVMAGP